MANKSFVRWLRDVVGGAAGVAVLWTVANRSWQVNGVGWLERQDWPLSNVYLCALAGGLIGAVVGLLRWRAGAAQSQEAKHAALALELAFQPEVTREELGEAAEMGLFKDWRSGSNRLTGLVDGQPVEMLDYTSAVESNEGDSEHTQTVALLPAPDSLPVFELRPRSALLRVLGVLGMEGITFDPEQAPPEDAPAVRDFRQRYFLSRGLDLENAELAVAAAEGTTVNKDEQEGPVRRLFTTEVLRHFAARPGWSVDSDGKHLAVWRARALVPGAGRERFLAEVLQVRQAIVLGAAGEGAVVPAGRGMGGAAAVQGRLLGAVLGLFAGMLVGMIVVGGHMRELRLLTPVCFLGVLVLGLVAGWYLGGLLLAPPLAWLQRRQEARQRQAVAESPWGQPLGSTAEVREEAGRLTVRIPPGGLLRGGGCALFGGCVLVNLFLIGFSAVWVPMALRGEVEWVEEKKPGQAPAPKQFMSPVSALLFLVPFWLAGLALLLALVYRARRRALLAVGAEGLSLEEVTLFGTRQQAWRREDLADVRAEEQAPGLHPQKLDLAVVPGQGEWSRWLGWRNRTEVKWLAELVRKRLGLSAQ
jgi:hypothetical protein